jgi:uncharacterized protein
MNPFHLSILVNNLEQARKFYSEILSLKEKRSTKNSVHYDFFGHHLVVNQTNLKVNDLTIEQVNLSLSQIKLDAFPYPHFGIILKFDDWMTLKKTLESKNINFIVEPCKRFIGEKYEQNVMFISDPSLNFIEIKHYTQLTETGWL